MALLKQHKGLELMDPEAPSLDHRLADNKDYDPARWIERNRRVLKTYQSLVRSAVALDALLDAEETNRR